jgi:hypothetical protein
MSGSPPLLVENLRRTFFLKNLVANPSYLSYLSFRFLHQRLKTRQFPKSIRPIRRSVKSRANIEIRPSRAGHMQVLRNFAGLVWSRTAGVPDASHKATAAFSPRNFRTETTDFPGADNRSDSGRGERGGLSTVLFTPAVPTVVELLCEPTAAGAPLR